MIRRATAIILAIASCLLSLPAFAYVEAPHSLGRIVNESTNIVVMRLEKVDKERNLLIYSKVQDLKGTHPQTTIKHNIGKAGFHPREWQNVMNWAEPGKIAIFFHNGGASETFIENYWYQAYPGGEWWNHSHGEPFLLRSFAGKPEKLAQVVPQMLAGQEVVVTCMMDGDKEALQLRTAKLQRLKASLKIMDYDQKRDFAGWGGDEFRSLAGMPGFTLYGALTRFDQKPNGIASADVDADGKADLCMFSEDRTILFKGAEKTAEEISLPYSGPARSASFADWNGDNKIDLLLATPTGPKLLTNTTDKGAVSFRDDSGALPAERYYNATAAAFLDHDGDGKLDVLLANGFLGLRLYKNRGAANPAAATAPVLGKWHMIGPFPNVNMAGHDQPYGPERGIDLKRTHTGKNNQQVPWKETAYKDGEINSLLVFGDQNDNSTAYVYREITASAPTDLPVSLGSDDSIKVFLNGQVVHSENTSRPAAPDQAQITLKLKPGKNDLLIKIGNGNGEFAFYFSPKAPVVATPHLFDDVSDKASLGSAGIASSARGDRLLVADLNGDAKPDFLYCTPTPTLALNAGNGTFTELKDSGLAFPGSRITPVLADFNGDKHLDLFIPDPRGSKLFLNNGQARFTDATAKAGDLAKPIPSATAATAADFNNSGKLDLLIACKNGPTRYLKNNGQASFTDASESLGLLTKSFNPRALLAADVNKDGILDLALTNESSDSALLISNPSRITK